MNQFGAIVMIFTVYLGAAALGLLLFGEGSNAVLFGGVLGTTVFFWIVKNTEK